MDCNSSLNVYILTYNRSFFLKQTIESVLKQSYSDFQLYILDNHSTDDTFEVVQSFQDKRLHYIRHEKNIGVGNNIRYALSHCKADYCVIFHDDDIMYATFLEREKNILDEYNEITLVSCEIKRIDTYGNDIEASFSNEYVGRHYKKQDLIRAYIKNGTVLAFPSIMYRMSFFRYNEIMFLDEPGPGADVIFYNNILRHGGVAYKLYEPLIGYRVHERQDSRISAKGLELELFQYMKQDKYYNSILEEMVDEQKNVFKRNGKTLCIEMLQNRVDTKEAYIFLNKYSDCWKHSKLHLYFFKMLIFIYMHAPIFTKKIYQIYEYLKKRGCPG